MRSETSLWLSLPPGNAGIPSTTILLVRQSGLRVEACEHLGQDSANSKILGSCFRRGFGNQSVELLPDPTEAVISTETRRSDNEDGSLTALVTRLRNIFTDINCICWNSSFQQSPEYRYKRPSGRESLNIPTQTPIWHDEYSYRHYTLLTLQFVYCRPALLCSAEWHRDDVAAQPSGTFRLALSGLSPCGGLWTTTWTSSCCSRVRPDTPESCPSRRS